MIDAAVGTLDRIPAPIAGSLLGAVRGLAAGVPADADPQAREAALAAHARLVAHVQRAVDSGPPDAALGPNALAALLSSAEATDVDLAALTARADAERDRLMERFAESAARIDRQRAPLDLARELVKDHPDRAGVIKTARYWTERAIAFTRERDLVPVHDGVCLVGESPESRRWAMAMISTNAPAERDAPSWYWITPPDESWPPEQAEEWLEVFSACTLPAITVHEVAPGHFSHHQALRRARGDVRRTLFSSAFVEGWAHYAEELCVEEGFLADDPRFAFGVWLEALVRVTRLACALGVHTAGHDGRGGGGAVRSGHPPDRPGGPVGGQAGDVRPDLRPVHLGQAGDHGAARAGQDGLGRGVHAQALPHRPDGPWLPAPGADRNRHRAGVTCWSCKGTSGS